MAIPTLTFGAHVSDTTNTQTTETNRPEPRKNRTWMIVLGVVVALGIVGAGWAVLYGPDGNTPVKDTDASGSSDEATQSVESTRTAEDTSTVVIEPEGGDTDPEYDPNADPPLIEQYTGMITDVKQSGGSYIVTVDYVRLVMGDEAKQAAEAHGDTVPESGLYVVNDNPLTRERAVDSGLVVRVTMDEAGKPNELGRSMPLAEWADAFTGPQEDTYRSGTYILTLTNGTVTLLEQLYIP